jgi:hypothetical protein
MSDLNFAKHLFAEGLAAKTPTASSASGEPSTAEGLRLLKAFTGIQDATLRRSVIHLVELLGATGAKR